MRSLLTKLWNDDAGAVLSTEYVMVSGVMVAGLVPALGVMRDKVIRATESLGDTVVAVVPPVPVTSRQASPTRTETSPLAANGVSAPAIVVVVQFNEHTQPALPTVLMLPPAP